MAPAEGFAAEGSQGPERLQGEVCGRGCIGRGSGNSAADRRSVRSGLRSRGDTNAADVSCRKSFRSGGRVSGHRRLFRRQRAERRRFVLSGMRAGESPCGAETFHARSSAGAENENAAGKAGCRRGGTARLPGGASSSRTAVGQREEACASLAAQSSWSAQVKQLGSVFVQQTRMPT